MGEFTDKAKGLGNQVAGSIKKGSADPDVREFQVVQQGDGLCLRVALRAGADGAPVRAVAFRLEP